MEFLRKFFDSNEKELKKHVGTVAKINSLEAETKALSNEQLRAKTDEFRARIQQAREAADPSDPDAVYRAEEEALDAVLPEAFACVREAAIRAIGQRHYDVQLIGGTALHQGRIAEMRTGEGKTLVATLPLYLNALSGHGTHLVTHNDYLAKRDAAWNGSILHLLGLTTAVIQGATSASFEDYQPSFMYDPDYHPDDVRWDTLRRITRIEAYRADVTYGVHSEFGFDYLRDNSAAHTPDGLVQRELHFAIVDEVDSILIDEARTPLIISGIPEESTDLYYRVDRAVARLQHEADYTIDEKARTAMLTDDGTPRLEQYLGVDNIADDVRLMHHISAALKARYVYKRDVDYVVKDGDVVIVDEFTGRLQFGRQWADGLHQAVQAKEGVKIEAERQTTATITYQNYFRLYKKLSGMTGTAKTEEDEFRKIYGLDVLAVPTNLPMIRKDFPDIIFKSEEAKFRGIAAEILEKHTLEQPVLVGSRSIDVSERLAERLNSERLQLLAMTLILQRKLYDKSVDKERRARHSQVLNQKMDDLWLAKLTSVIKDLGANPDPLSADNVGALAEILEVKGKEARLRGILQEGIAPRVLNAKYHEREAEIISEAGHLAAVTIATNMAGRGVDILLGGKPATNPNYEEEHAAVLARGGLHIIGSERHESRRIDNQLRGRAGRQGDMGSSRFYVSLDDELWRLFGDKGRWLLNMTWDEAEPIEHSFLSKAIEKAQKKVEENNFAIRKHILEYDDVMNMQRKVIYGMRRKVLDGQDLLETIYEYIGNLIEREVNAHCGEAPADEWDLKGLYATLDTLFPLSLYAALEDLSGRTQADLQEWLMQLAEHAYEVREHELTSEVCRNVERMVTLHVIDEKWIHHLQAIDYLREGIGFRAYAQMDPLVQFKKEAFEYFEGLNQAIERDVVAYMFHVSVQAPPPMPRPVIRAYTEGDGTAEGTRTATALDEYAGNGDSRAKVGRNELCPCGSGKKYKKCCLIKETAQ